jgi:hypothetical protein
VSSDRQQAKSGLSATTLMIASASSVAAAVLVSKLWGPGTLLGAAMTPVIVTLVSEALHRPAKVIDTVRVTRAARFDPVAEGRRGLREGDLDDARPAAPGGPEPQRRVHTAERAGGRTRTRMPRPRVMAAIATGLVAFVLAGVFLTGSELVLGQSVVSSSKRTTYIPVNRGTSSASDTKQDKTDTTQDTTTTTTPTTTTAPPTTTTTPPVQGTPPTAPPAQTTPAAPPATTPPGPAAPPTTQPTPAPPPATPAPTTP